MAVANDTKRVKFAETMTGINMDTQTQCMSGVCMNIQCMSGVYIPPNEKLCEAKDYRGWNICLWGRPKLSIICGHCDRPFKTRDYFPRNNHAGYKGLAAHCPACAYWNWMDMQYK